MSATTAAPLRFTHASGLHNVAAALTSLHQQRLRAGDSERSPVRASVVNIVAACTDAADAARAAADLIAIGVRHPSRAIVILAEPDGAPAIEADVSLECATAGSAACSEMVRLRVAGEPAFHLVSVVTPLLAADIPVQLWIVGAPPLRQPFTPDVVAMCERIILDSGAYGDAEATVSTLAEQLQRYGERLWIADLAWERARPWRLAVANAFDTPDTRPLLDAVRRVSLRCGTQRRTDALLLAGWLRHRTGATVAPPAVDADGAGIVAVQIDGDGGSVAVRRCDDALRIEVTVGERCTASHAVRPDSAGITEDAALIIRLMSETGDDPMYRGAVAHAGSQ